MSEVQDPPPCYPSSDGSRSRPESSEPGCGDDRAGSRTGSFPLREAKPHVVLGEREVLHGQPLLPQTRIAVVSAQRIVPFPVRDRDVTREAFKVALITDGEQWMAMIQSRNISLHTYDDCVAEQLVDVIIQRYYPLFVALKAEMEKYLS